MPAQEGRGPRRSPSSGLTSQNRSTISSARAPARLNQLCACSEGTSGSSGTSGRLRGFTEGNTHVLSERLRRTIYASSMPGAREVGAYRACSASALRPPPGRGPRRACSMRPRSPQDGFVRLRGARSRSGGACAVRPGSRDGGRGGVGGCGPMRRPRPRALSAARKGRRRLGSHPRHGGRVRHRSGPARGRGFG